MSETRKIKTVELETACAKLMELADQYERTEVAEYQGEYHVRCGRKVVAVFNVLEGTLRINTIETPEQRSRVNDVLEILRVPQRRATAIEVDVPGSSVKAQAEAWEFNGDGYESKVLTCFAPRETFTLAYLASPFADEYATTDEDEDGEPITVPQPLRSWIEDNLRDVTVASDINEEAYYA